MSPERKSACAARLWCVTRFRFSKSC